MHKKLVILGSGESGTGAAILAKRKGFDVFVSDKGKIKDIYKNKLQEEGITFEEGTHSYDIIFAADEINLTASSREEADKPYFSATISSPLKKLLLATAWPSK